MKCFRLRLPPSLPVQLRDPKTGKFIPNPKKPRSPYPELTDTQRRAEWKRIYNDPNSGLTEEQRRDKGKRVAWANTEKRIWRARDNGTRP